MIFCGKKRLFAMFLGWAAALAAWQAGEVLDVQTLDGRLYRQAKLMSADDGGISILCADPKGGDPILRGITFDRLPQELRTRFGYDAEKFAAYQKKVGTYRPPEGKKKEAPASIAPAAPTKPAAAPASENVSGQVLGPSQFDYYTYGTYFWDRPPRRYWFGPNDVRPRPYPKPGPRPKPGPGPRPLR